jgi:hypothetical protein
MPASFRLAILLFGSAVLAVIASVVLATSSKQARIQVVALPPEIASDSSNISNSTAEPTFPAQWKDASIGDPQYLGGHSVNDNTLTITGAGEGIDVRGKDQLQFAYVTREPGDLTVIARLREISGEGDIAAGIMVRTDHNSATPMTAVYYSTKGNTVGWKTRFPDTSGAAPTRSFASSIPLARTGPLWLKMVRLGKNFAAYKSRDGKLWVMISNNSGGPIAIDGEAQVGFFISGSTKDKPVTATFDSITIGPTELAYKTSWVGNTFGCRTDDQHVSNGLSSMWVAPDGTCYTSTYWDEAGQPVTSYRDGKVSRALPIGTPQTAEGGITGDARQLYVAHVDRISQLDPASPYFAPKPLVVSPSLFDKKTNHSVVSGMASNGRELFVADSRANMIRVVHLDPIPGARVATPAKDVAAVSSEWGDRKFAFERPGPMTFDSRGDLWIIERGNDFPIGAALTAKYPAAIKCYHPDGSFSGRAITDVVNPRAVAHDNTNDRLLVAENSPDLNVRIYDHLPTAPALATTFGEKRGIYSGLNPGLVYDRSAGGHARFSGLAGLGVDRRGNLYVGGGFQGTDLRKFGPDGRFEWMINSLMFCNTYDVDPDSDGAEIYSTFNHLHLDLSKTEPGTEQTYISYNWDLGRFGEPARPANSQAIVRRIGPERRLVMYTTGQGAIDHIRIFRYEGEIAIPAGRIKDSELWIDSSGDGKEAKTELTIMKSPVHNITGVSVDSRGDLWTAVSIGSGSFMRHFSIQGLTSHGAPIYSGISGAGYEDIQFPEEGGKLSAWSMSSRLDYDADRDIMALFYPAVARASDGDTSPPQYFLARYDNWSKGNRAPKWKIKGLRPETDPDYFMYEKNIFRYSFYSNMQIAGKYLFMAFLFGEIHVRDLETGQLVEILSMGPEVNGRSAWEDAAMGLRVFLRRNGEYLIFTENSGWGGKNNFVRWKPQ